MDLIERGWKEENTNKKKKTEPKSLKRKNSKKKNGDAVQALSNLFG